MANERTFLTTLEEKARFLADGWGVPFEEVLEAMSKALSREEAIRDLREWSVGFVAELEREFGPVPEDEDGQAAYAIRVVREARRRRGRGRGILRERT